MNNLMTITNEITNTTTSIDLRNKINELRTMAGQSKIENNKFNLKIEDEIDDLGVSTIILHPQSGVKMRSYNLNEDQMLQVGMRESKIVRKGVVQWIKQLQNKQPQVPTTFREALLLAASQQLQIEEQTLEINNKSIEIAEKSLEIETKNEILLEQEAPVAFANAVAGANTSILVSEYAKLISGKGLKIGGNRLFKLLRDKNVLMTGNYKNDSKHNIPYQQYINAGLLELKETVITSQYKSKLVFTTKITGSGQKYFFDKIKKELEKN